MSARRVASLTSTALLSLVVGAAAADTRVTMREGSGLVGDGAGMPEAMRRNLANQEPEIAVYWMGGDRVARVVASGKMVARLDLGETWVIDDAEKSYFILKLDEIQDVLPQEAHLERGTETRQVGSWEAVRYDLTIGTGEETMKVVYWVSEEVEVDDSDYKAFLESMARQGAEWIRSFLEVDGFPVRQEATVGSIATWQEVVEISDMDAPAGTYEIPAGYQRVE